MPRYCVNATKTLDAWLEVEADSPEDALEQARTADASAFEHDNATAEVEFNVTPEVDMLLEQADASAFEHDNATAEVEFNVTPEVDVL